MQWTNGGIISAESNYRDGNKFIRLIYPVTKDGQKTEYDYRIELHTKRSNVGVGEVLYFICPSSGRLCKTLYMVYGSHIWKHRDAYRNRIYYQSQIRSKFSKYNDRYCKLDNVLKELLKLRETSYYNGLPTKRALRTQRLLEEQNRMDDLRYGSIARWLSKRNHLPIISKDLGYLLNRLREKIVKILRKNQVKNFSVENVLLYLCRNFNCSIHHK